MDGKINQDSIQSLKKFRENQVKNNVKLHLIFLVLISIIDIGLIFFIISYKSKISSLKSKTNNNDNLINTNKDLIEKNNNDIAHKYVNIIAMNTPGSFRFSLLFETSQEVKKIQNKIIEFYKDKNRSIDINKIKMHFLFQCIMEGDTFMELRNKIDMSSNTLILIESDNNIKFGFYFEKPILFYQNEGFKDSDNNCFLFSFNHEGIFKCIGNGEKIKINYDENMLVIGEDDIIIKNNFLLYDEKRGIDNFPYKAIDTSTINKNIFTNSDGKFSIVGLEIFSFEFD